MGVHDNHIALSLVICYAMCNVMSCYDIALKYQHDANLSLDYGYYLLLWGFFVRKCFTNSFVDKETNTMYECKFYAIE